MGCPVGDGTRLALEVAETSFGKQLNTNYLCVLPFASGTQFRTQTQANESCHCYCMRCGRRFGDAVVVQSAQEAF
jgi:hypothetical protein